MNKIDIVHPLIGFAAILGIVKLWYTFNLQSLYAVEYLLHDIFYPPNDIIYVYRTDKADKADKADKVDKADKADRADKADKADKCEKR